MYNGARYLVPFGYHYAGMFYNAKVMADAGVTEFPTTWDGFLALCADLKAKGVTPIALGSKNRWPAQFWFDYLLLRTAGPDYRAKLMAGEAAYTDDEVKAAMGMWKDLVDAGYFAPNANADGWTDASDRVARGDAAMTLMGTWITGYWNGNGLDPGRTTTSSSSRRLPTAFRTQSWARSTGCSSPPTRRTARTPRSCSPSSSRTGSPRASGRRRKAPCRPTSGSTRASTPR